MERIKKLLGERKDSRSHEEIVKAAFITINQVVGAIFDDMPNVNVISAEGHVPYFNDGDPCVWKMRCSVDWLGRDNVYHSPVHLSSYSDPELNGEDTTEFAELFTKRDPGYQKRKEEPDYGDLGAACDLVHTLSDEFEIINRDADGGTWWVFVRDEETPIGFSVKTGEFSHD
tara:strand:+ start:556 stop:1071 length:516 start_codon:yes stop_codon:yes gene_type:complete